MKRRKLYSLRSLFGLLMFSVLLLLCGSAGVAFSQTPWWQKGVDVLKNTVATKQVSSQLSVDEIAKAFKEALHIGAENVVKQLGREDGFNTDDAIHIPLPDEFAKVKSLLARIRMSHLLDDLETKLNRAAEAATPEARALFWKAIGDMNFEDVKAIYDGPDDAATKYFQEKMSPALAEKMRPIVDQSLARVGAVKAYDNVMAKYRTLPFVPDVKANLKEHVVDKGMDGIFYYMAQEEAAIRRNPAKRTTELLRKVFGKK